MTTRKIHRPVLALAVAALAAPAVTVAAPVSANAAAGPAVVSAASTAPPTSFVDLPTSPLPTDRAPHEVSFQYRNDSAGDQIIAPQVLIEGPVNGPFLDPRAISLRVENADGSWQTLPLGVQTGTLFTDLIPAKHVLHSHHTLTEHYRLTLLKPSPGTVAPRIALYR
ncbi:hypothetical protein [Kitasatospora mediocidica]|uniref:hypothetical protein n=1 Tax=Kitasatospora mediocidica TaxID=58352 RepID=UPI000A506907|nr:hypothetical protein [Kitasatospora mediocidica]